MTYYLSLGANIGAREQTIREATRMIGQQIGPVLRCSSFFYSEPWGFSSPNPFCNVCCAVETPLAPVEVLSLTQSIERAIGRKEKSQTANGQSQMANGKWQTANYTDRCIDIDIIRLFDAEGRECTVSLPELIIPHPLWQERDFVKVPLAQIMD